MSKKKRQHGFPPLPEPLPAAVYDNHTHLDPVVGDEFTDPEGERLTLTEHLDRAVAVGIAGVVQVGTDLASSRWSAQAAAKDARVLAAVALHPNEAPRLAQAGTLDDALDEIAGLASQPRVRALGETGLDFFRTGESGRAAQLASFEAHIEIAKQTGRALQIHDRDAHEEVAATLKRVGPPARTVLHCFSGDSGFAKRCAAEGWFMSFPGIVTFKNAQSLRDALLEVPDELLLVETDAPFLTPAPFRGRPNSPYLIPHTMRAMAQLRGADLEALCLQVADNTRRVYGSWDTDAPAAPNGPDARSTPGAPNTPGSLGIPAVPNPQE